MRSLIATSLFLSAALLMFVVGGGTSVGQPGGKKADKKAKPGKGGDKKGTEKAKPEPEKKPPTAWEEYLEFAPRLSMSVDHFSAQLFRPTVDIAGRPLKAAVPHDARLKKAMAEIAAAQKKGEQGADPVTRGATDVLVDAGTDKLIEKGIPGAVTGDKRKEAEGLFGALVALGALKIQGDATAKVQTAALAEQAKSWQSVVEIPKANAGPAAEKPPLKFEVVVGPIRERSAEMTNVSGQDLRNVTLYLRTGLSPGQEEYFVFIPSWKKGETRQLSRALVLKTMDVANPVPYKNAFQYSVWCPELSAEGVVLHLPNQRPRIAGASYFLCVPEAKKK